MDGACSRPVSFCINCSSFVYHMPYRHRISNNTSHRTYCIVMMAGIKGNLSASVEKIGLIVMSVMACFVGGFLCGKKNIKKRYLWGLGVGVLYCLFFGVIRVGMGQAFVTDTTAFFTMMLYCAAGGMLGGMLS